MLGVHATNGSCMCVHQRNMRVYIYCLIT
jgi:hypothetical protein